MKRLFILLLLLPALLNAQNLRRWGSTGAISTLHGDWLYNAHPTYSLADSLKLVDFRLLKDTAAALRAAMGGGSGMAIGGTVTSGTTGSILFIGSSSALAQDNSNFFWDNTNKRFGLGTASPAYRLDILRAATGQTATSRTHNVSTAGSTFNTTSGALLNHAGYFTADATVSAGGFSLTNIGVMGMATGGDNNFGIGTSNSSFTGAGYFYQSANNTTRLQGGPGTDNIAFGPDNRIRLNVPSVIIPSGSLSVGANSDDGIGAIQAYGKITVTVVDSSASPANILWQDPITKEIKKAAVLSGSSDLTGAAVKTNIHVVSDANYTVASTDYIIIYSTLSTGRTLTIPAASSAPNRMLIIKHGGGGANNITVSETLRENVSVTGNTISTGQSFGIVSDGTEWWIVWIANG